MWHFNHILNTQLLIKFTKRKCCGRIRKLTYVEEEEEEQWLSKILSAINVP